MRELAEHRNMLVTVKSREIQRGMLAEMSGHAPESARHFLAAAHLELVLAADYELADDADLAWRSRISAASCLWRAGRPDEARHILADLKDARPDRASEIDEVVRDLEGNSR
jgi:hypothetical protein